ncbi:MAG: anti-sigma factor family protein [Candidatus Binataceae bacterium]
MICAEVRALLDAYADAELDLVRSLELERHLEHCGECTRVRDNLVATGRAVRTAAPYYIAPVALREYVHALTGPQPSTRLMRWMPREGGWPWLITAAAVLAAVVVSVRGFTPVIPSPRLLADEAVASHVRSLMVSHLADVASSNQHTVKPWFDGKLDFAPVVEDLARQGFPLSGGRLDYFDSRPVAALVYRRRAHIINLFSWPMPGESNSSAKAEVIRGYNVVHWNQAGMTYWAVSDLDLPELHQFAGLFAQAAALAPHG